MQPTILGTNRDGYRLWCAHLSTQKTGWDFYRVCADEAVYKRAVYYGAGMEISRCRQLS